ncbi:Phosphomethylpyrimidine kinase-domain-containing protein [Xylariales sp. PMI_506]|nr:Phosphomethylpyrimidine kinase-domain-containing protein [Xylariales sp. PMI_506]
MPSDSIASSVIPLDADLDISGLTPLPPKTATAAIAEDALAFAQNGKQSSGNSIQGKVLVIAGSDSSGGAGLEADQKVIAAHGCYAMTATTALTAQNTMGVNGIHHVPPEFVRKQIDAVFADIKPDVVKTGMLASAATIKMLDSACRDHGVDTLILDPVMVATTGAVLLPPEAVTDLRTLLLPQTFLVTPNIPEAKLLLSGAEKEVVEIRTIDDLETIARQVQDLGPKWVLIKGGHIPFKQDGTVATAPEERKLVVNVLFGEGRATRFVGAYQESRNTHGTGCSLASAIASNIAKGFNPVDAIRAASQYIEAGIRTAPGYGRGSGPLNHFHSLYTLPFAPDRFISYLLNRPEVAPIWQRFVYHPFVLALGSGKLPLNSFKGYLVQDYLYLVHFARANALASYKAKNMLDVAAGAKIVTHIHTEMQLHLDYCAGFGLSKADIESTEEQQACTAYTRYVLDIGQSQDWLALQLALAPCLLGYGAIARMLHDDSRTDRTDTNTYWKWILNYVADDYVEAVKTGWALIERHAVLQSPSRIEELVKIFAHATKMEVGFWEMFPYE